MNVNFNFFYFSPVEPQSVHKMLRLKHSGVCGRPHGGLVDGAGGHDLGRGCGVLRFLLLLGWLTECCRGSADCAAAPTAIPICCCCIWCCKNCNCAKGKVTDNEFVPLKTYQESPLTAAVSQKRSLHEAKEFHVTTIIKLTPSK